MDRTAITLAIVSAVIAVASAVIAALSVRYARQQARSASQAVDHAKAAAEAATRSADLAEVVEAGRHFGWRIMPLSGHMFVLRNVGTVNALDVTLSNPDNAYPVLSFHTETADKTTAPVIAAGQSRLFNMAASWSSGTVEVGITWTPDLPDAERMTWTESPPQMPVGPDESDWRKIVKAVTKLADGR